jgi:transposase
MEKREAFVTEVAAVEPGQLVFLDESGSNISMAREYGRSPRGERIVERVPRNRGTVTTMIGALALNGLRALMTNEGGTSKEVFMRFLRDYLVPALRRGDVVVMDNLGAHHADGVRELIESAGARVLYLPAYSPDLNPIEEFWSKLKYLLKTFAARTACELLKAIELAKTFVTVEDAEGWFRDSGYLSNQLA